MSRAIASEKTFAEAKAVADANSIDLSNPSDGCYQMRHRNLGWIINMYPRRGGLSPRMYHDRHHRGPFLKLPVEWTLLDCVNAAIKASMQSTEGKSK